MSSYILSMVLFSQMIYIFIHITCSKISIILCDTYLLCIKKDMQNWIPVLNTIYKFTIIINDYRRVNKVYFIVCQNNHGSSPGAILGIYWYRNIKALKFIPPQIKYIKQ